MRLPSKRVQSCRQRMLLLFTTVLAYWDVLTDVLVAVNFAEEGSWEWAVPSFILVLLPSIFLACAIDHKWSDRILSILHLRLLWEAVITLRDKKASQGYSSVKYVESVLESLPQSLLQTYLLLSRAGMEGFSLLHGDEMLLLASLLSSTVSLSWSMTLFLGNARISRYTRVWGHLGETLWKQLYVAIGALHLHYYFFIGVACSYLLRLAMWRVGVNQISKQRSAQKWTVSLVALFLDSSWSKRWQIVLGNIISLAEGCCLLWLGYNDPDLEYLPWTLLLSVAVFAILLKIIVNALTRERSSMGTDKDTSAITSGAVADTDAFSSIL